MIKKIFFILLAAVLLQNSISAQEKADQRTITTRIADLYAQLPAQNSELLNAGMKEISSMGEDGYATMIGGMAAEGKGNNALLEYAVGGYSAYVSKAGREEAKKMSINAYCKALGKLSDNQNKSFIISQLELVGDDSAISCLQGFLTDVQLADPAARALVKINSPASKSALLNGLGKANGQAQQAIVNALGDSRLKEAAGPVNALVATADQDLKKVALYALANIADPSSEKIMTAEAEKSGFQYENTNATASALLYTEMLLKDGNNTLSGQIAESFLKQATADNQVGIRSAALKILVDSRKNESSNILITAAGDKNIQYRAAALKFSAPYLNPASAALWIDKMEKSDAVIKAEIVTMLGANRTKEALPAILKLLNSKDEQVKFGAIVAAANIGQSQVLNELLQVMGKGDAKTAEVVSGAIQRMKGEGIPATLAQAIPKANPAFQIALVDLLACRAANDQLAAVSVLLKSKNEKVRQAAFASLKQLVTSADLPQLFTLLNTTSDQTSLTAVQDAIIAANKGTANRDQQADQLLQQMSTATEDKKPLFYKMLAGLGGKKSLEAVQNGFKTGNELNQKAAIAALAFWTDSEAARPLIQLAGQTKNSDFANQAIEGYLGLIRKADYPAEQKLLLLREAMSLAKTTAQQQEILKDLENAKSFNSLIFAGKYLDDPALQATAANTVMNIALADKSYHGTLVKSLLDKTMLKLKGADGEYQKQAIRKYLAEMPKEEGFVTMFNGKDLTGWQGLVEDPIKRSKMDPKALAAAQEKANIEMLDSWHVVNGELLFMSHGNNLATIKKYGDFEMLVDWKIIDDHKQKGDAGIYLRGSPQVQIWDNARISDGAQVGSGGLYNNQVNESKPLKVADNKLDEWNTFRILMKGDRVTVHLNGELVTDNVILENYWDRKLPIFSEEQIELQAHGSPVAYRDVYIREIPRAKPFELSAAEKKEGFKVLFDGTNMYNWMGNTTDYVIEDGNIAIRPKPGKGSGGNLFTKDEYSNFIFRFEFQLTPGANNGLGIRAPLTGDAAYEGMELQILDDDAPIYKDLHVYQYHGSIYGTIPAKRGFLKPVGEWNYEEVIVKGPKVKVILNGTSILDADLTDARKNGAADGQKHPGLMRDSGHIGFLGHGSPVQFRNIRIKDLGK
ncbi:HEAT repeat protein [Pedobacter cryoconitis]|uniref:HEAT repeat protein n=1 Tax=Pedobacter cryoconitis TaxID=188932 RepID=A0A7W8ZIH6_9SPHI|nr:family 16 glycoside hydrolase [Pedobacter cryoconitis]MBB5634548.1 HEAT repeat protein [Pedobacter cryoconitis]